MNVVVNGQLKSIEPGMKLRDLLEFLELKADRCAVELNQHLVPRAQWDGTTLRPNDELEIVHFVGGG